MSANNAQSDAALEPASEAAKSTALEFDLSYFSKDGVEAFMEGNTDEQSDLYNESVRAAKVDGVDIVSRKHVQMARKQRRAAHMPTIYQYLGNAGFMFMGFGLEPFISGEVAKFDVLRLYIVGTCLVVGGILSALQIARRR